MSDTATAPSPSDERDPANEPAGASDILLGAGQGAWLAVVTVVAGLALALSIVALLRDNGEGGGAPVGPVGPATEVTFVATDFAFDPATVTVVSATDVPVTLDNQGATNHNWALLPAGVTVSGEDQLAGVELLTVVGDEVAGIAGGATADGTLNLEPGSYQFVCLVPGHFSAGMTGTLTAQ